MLVSICIPTYSRVEYLKIAVESCLNQTYPSVEICISQDLMKNGVLNHEVHSYCKAISSQYTNVSYTHNEENLGLAGNWNKLVKIARGEYIIIIGDDDILAPDFLSVLLKDIEQEKPDVIFSNQWFIGSEGETLAELTALNNKEYKRDLLVSGRLKNAVEVVFNNSVPMSASLIRRKWFSALEFDSSLNTPEFEVFLKIALGGGVFVYHHQQLGYYRVHLQSETSGGLSIHKLIVNLLDINVPKEYEIYKYHFISSKIVPGINMALRAGDKQRAQRLLFSGYYPNRYYHYKLVQISLLWMPTWLAQKIL